MILDAYWSEDFIPIPFQDYTVSTGTRASKFQDGKDVDILRSPITHKKYSNLIVYFFLLNSQSV